jgi:hypothetical protein
LLDVLPKEKKLFMPSGLLSSTGNPNKIQSHSPGSYFSINPKGLRPQYKNTAGKTMPHLTQTLGVVNFHFIVPGSTAFGRLTPGWMTMPFGALHEPMTTPSPGGPACGQRGYLSKTHHEPKCFPWRPSSSTLSEAGGFYLSR